MESTSQSRKLLGDRPSTDATASMALRFCAESVMGDTQCAREKTPQGKAGMRLYIVPLANEFLSIDKESLLLRG
jgi:hypothetical protein